MAEILRCGSCGERDLADVLDLGSQPLAEHDNGKRYPLKLVRCANCTLVQLSYIPDQQEVFPLDHPYVTGSTRVNREHFADLAEEVDCFTRPGELIVDLGANDGTLLAAYEDDVRLAAVEPTDQIFKCPERAVLYREFFTAELGMRIRSELGPAAVITACNVFAHVPDPHDFLDGVTALLADDGVFITENHDWASIANGLQIDTVYHEHLRYYSAASLSYLLTRHSLLVTRMEPVAMHGGSLRTCAVRERGSLGMRAGKLRESLRSLLGGLQGDIYGIGACTRATPLIHYADIAGYLACVCEIPGSEKIGTSIPGTGIPVVDEAELIKDQPPYALLLSWHIADSVIPALRAKGYRGKFIIPLPEPRITDG